MAAGVFTVKIVAKESNRYCVLGAYSFAGARSSPTLFKVPHMICLNWILWVPAVKR